MLDSARAINMSQLIGQILFYPYINRQSADEFRAEIKLAVLSRDADGVSTRVAATISTESTEQTTQRLIKPIRENGGRPITLTCAM